MRARQLWPVVWKAGVCILLLGWVFHSIFVLEGHRAWSAAGQDWEALPLLDQWRQAWIAGPPELWGSIRQLQFSGACWSMVFMGMTILLGVLRWRLVLGVQGLQLSLGRAAEISLVAHFFNSFLLGSTGGDLMKAYYAARETRQLKAEAVMTVVADRLIGLLSMLLFAVAMMLPNLELLARHQRLWMLAMLVVGMLVGGFTLAALSFRGGVSRRWPAARTWLRRLPRGESLERALNATRRYGGKPGFFLRTLGLSMALNVCCVMQYWALAGGLGLAIKPVTLFLLVPMIICVSALPITPSGLGVRENLYVWSLAVPEIGVPATKALSLSLLAYAGSLAWSVMG
ncbi:MAG: lysylphosphatidylglycerol synthase transmembrane domain-containing protein, partial [Limisphaerales bacterium]